jgi:hypothetical protein
MSQSSSSQVQGVTRGGPGGAEAHVAHASVRRELSLLLLGWHTTRGFPSSSTTALDDGNNGRIVGRSQISIETFLDRARHLHMRWHFAPPSPCHRLSRTALQACRAGKKIMGRPQADKAQRRQGSASIGCSAAGSGSGRHSHQTGRVWRIWNLWLARARDNTASPLTP